MANDQTTDWLTPAQAYALVPDAIFTPKSLARAGDAGRIIIRKTPGGVRRYSRTSLLAFITQHVAAAEEREAS